MVGVRGKDFVSASCAAAGSGDVLVGSLLLRSIGNTLSPDAALTVAGNTVKIGDGVDYTLEGAASTEFPEAPEVEGPTLALSRQLVQAVVKHVSYGAAIDESRRVLTCVRLDKSAFVTADGFRISVLSHNLAVETPVNIPVGLFRLLPQLGPEVLLTTDDENLHFAGEDGAITCRAIPDKFPDYAKLIPTYNKAVTIDRKTLLSIVWKLTPVAAECNGILRLVHQKGIFTITTQAPEVGTASGSLETAGDTDWKIAFNAQYLSDLLSHWTCEQINVSIGTPADPGLFAAVGAENKLISVIMPMFVLW